MACKFTITQSRSQPLPVIMGVYRWYCAEGRSRDGMQTDTGDVCSTATTNYYALFPPFLSCQIALATEPPAEDWLKFQNLVAQWRRERGAMSSITEMVLCLAYQSIIGMGPNVVPLILAQLESERDEPDQWFWALQVLTGENPVSREDRGNYLRMAQSWLAWARNREYAW